MKEKLITLLIRLIIEMLSPELLMKFADMVLDFCENFVLGTKSTIDDRVILPLCAQIRGAFDILDND